MARRLKKPDRTVDAYCKAAAYLRLATELTQSAMIEVSSLLPSGDGYKVFKAEQAVLRIKSITEDSFFKDHPDLEEAYNHVFYGSVNPPYKSDAQAVICASMRDRMRVILERGLEQLQEPEQPQEQPQE